MPVSPSAATLVAFLLCVAWVCLAVVAGVRHTCPDRARNHQTTIATIAVLSWLVLTALPTATGLLNAENPVPAGPIFFGVLFMSAGVFAASPLGKRLALGVPLAALVGFQAFRLPLELILHEWVAAGVIPPQMTWGGANPDIIAGLTALLLAPIAARYRAAAWVALFVGGVLLANVIRVVVVSMPTPFQQYDTIVPLIFEVPTVWIGSVSVTGAMLGHLLLLRRLVTGPELRACESPRDRVCSGQT